MILRRFTKHVSDQNWFAVGLDIFVVIFGVYIGIFLGEISDERATRSDVNDALQVVRLQLKEDLKTLDGIIAYRQEKLQEPVRLMPLVGRQEIDKADFGDGLLTAFGRLFTFFPKSSGYASMKDRGYLARLDDPHLQDALAHLFDHVYTRNTVNGDESDQNTFFYERNVVAVYWNIENPDFVGDEEIARARLQNALSRLESYSAWYVQFLRENVRPAIVAAIEAIEGRQGGLQLGTR